LYNRKRLSFIYIVKLGLHQFKKDISEHSEFRHTRFILVNYKLFNHCCLFLRVYRNILLYTNQVILKFSP